MLIQTLRRFFQTLFPLLDFCPSSSDSAHSPRQCPQANRSTLRRRPLADHTFKCLSVHNRDLLRHAAHNCIYHACRDRWVLATLWWGTCRRTSSWAASSTGRGCRDWCYGSWSHWGDGGDWSCGSGHWRYFGWRVRGCGSGGWALGTEFEMCRNGGRGWCG